MLQNRPAVFLILVMVVGLVLPPDVEAFNNLPEDFNEQIVLPGLGQPTAIAWLPDGQMLVTTKSGGVVRDSGEVANPVLDLSSRTCDGSETGLLGLAVDPNFGSGQRYIYVYYTFKKGSCNDAAGRVNRLSRFSLDGNLSPGPEDVLLDNISAKGGNHNGGDVQFGKDGLLYVSVGDAGTDIVNGNGQNGNGNARRLSLLNGKILRVTPDGAVPASNPFTGAGTTSCALTGQAPVLREDGQAQKKKKKRKGKKGKNNNSNKKKQKRKRQHKNNQNQQQPPPGQQPTPPGANPPTGDESVCQEIYATGLRNPYRIAFDPDGTAGNQRLYINDVGGGAWEEIDQASAGADYGWNVREGPCPTGSQGNCAPDGRFSEPIFAYPHVAGCCTITGGAFVPDASGWPADFLDAYLFSDFISGQISILRDESTGQSLPALGSGTRATHLAFGPDNALYYTTFEGGGQVRKIVYQPN